MTWSAAFTSAPAAISSCTTAPKPQNAAVISGVRSICARSSMRMGEIQKGPPPNPGTAIPGRPSPTAAVWASFRPQGPRAVHRCRPHAAALAAAAAAADAAQAGTAAAVPAAAAARSFLYPEHCLVHPILVGRGSVLSAHWGRHGCLYSMACGPPPSAPTHRSALIHVGPVREHPPHSVQVAAVRRPKEVFMPPLRSPRASPHQLHPPLLA
jgi:hypothetical protein